MPCIQRRKTHTTCICICINRKDVDNMFIIKDAKTKQTTKTNDIRDSFDIIIGITGNESEALRVYAIMSNMLFGDKFSNTKYSVECVRDIPNEK